MTVTNANNRMTLEEGDIEHWFVTKFAALNGHDETNVDVNMAFADISLDSSLAVTLTGELSEWVQVDFPVTLFWEYPSINEITDYVIKCIQEEHGGLR